jgi:translation elongation factor EF-G
MIKNTQKFNKLVQVRNAAEKRIESMNKVDRQKLEVQLDVEHAYYSSALEGSRLDRKTFDELAKKANV